MSITTHIKSLKRKHHELEVELHSAYIHHSPTTEIAELKKKKLKIKDEIALLHISNKNMLQHRSAA